MNHLLQNPNPSFCHSIATPAHQTRANAWARLPATAVAALKQGGGAGRKSRARSDGQQSDSASLQAAANITAAPILPAVTLSPATYGSAAVSTAATATVLAPVQAPAAVDDILSPLDNTLRMETYTQPPTPAATQSPVPAVAKPGVPALEDEDQYGFDFDVLPPTLATLLAEATGGSAVDQAPTSPPSNLPSPVSAPNGCLPASGATSPQVAVPATDAPSKSSTKRRRAAATQSSPGRVAAPATQPSAPQDLQRGSIERESSPPETQQPERAARASQRRSDPKQTQRSVRQARDAAQQTSGQASSHLQSSVQQTLRHASLLQGAAQQALGQAPSPQQSSARETAVQQQSRWLSSWSTEPSAIKYTDTSESSLHSAYGSKTSDSLGSSSTHNSKLTRSRDVSSTTGTAGQDWGGFVRAPEPAASPYAPSLGSMPRAGIAGTAGTVDRPSVFADRSKPRDEWWQLPWQEAAGAARPGALKPQSSLSPIRGGGTEFAQAGDAANTLFVKGLPAQAPEDLARAALVAAFSEAGPLVQVRLPSRLLPNGQRELRGIAFLVFQTVQAKERALNDLSERCVLGRWVQLDVNPDSHGTESFRRLEIRAGSSANQPDIGAAPSRASRTVRGQPRGYLDTESGTGIGQSVQKLATAAGLRSVDRVTSSPASTDSSSSIGNTPRRRRRGGYLPA